MLPPVTGAVFQLEILFLCEHPHLWGKSTFEVLTIIGHIFNLIAHLSILKSIYTDIPYVNLEDIDIRNNAINDPRGFLNNFPNGAVLDEVQRVPELFSYIQGIVDSSKNIHFVLSGSQNFLLLQSITQSLAGRAAILKLLPFGMSELQADEVVIENYEEMIYKGLYPGLYDRKIEPNYFYPSYISTYIERDVRLIKNIENLNVFSNFLKLCAGRTGQIVNLNSLAVDAGISPNTAKSWLSILEASYIIYYLQPYYKNFNKRITKSPKLYFYDTGLACSLLGINSAEQVKTYYLKGALFENLIIDKSDEPVPCEIKSGMTMNDSYFANLKYWQKITGKKSENLNVIYGGNISMKTSLGNFIAWNDLRHQGI